MNTHESGKTQALQECLVSCRENHPCWITSSNNPRDLESLARDLTILFLTECQDYRHTIHWRELENVFTTFMDDTAALLKQKLEEKKKEENNHG